MHMDIPYVAPFDFIKMRCYEDIWKAISNGRHRAMNQQRGFGVNVNAVQVLRLVDGSKQTFSLLHVLVHCNAAEEKVGW